MRSPFHSLPTPPADVVFETAKRAKAAGSDAINGTVGMVHDEQGKPVILPSVRKAMEEYCSRSPDVGYGSLGGIDRYLTAVRNLLGVNQEAPAVSTTGGTEAVSVNAKLLGTMYADASIAVPTPTWGNHQAVFKEAGVHVHEVPYFNQDGSPSIHGLRRTVQEGIDAVLLHGVCHNPTGLDFTEEQWQDLAKILKKHDTIALVDIAYQGFGVDPEQDAKPLSILQEHDVPTLAAWSASKNHTLYNERVGASIALTSDAASHGKIQKAYERTLRTTHSSSPAYGQRIVSAVQENFRQDWLLEVAEVRSTIAGKRERLRALLPEEFEHPLSGNGLFALLPLSPEQIAMLEKEKVFLLPDGRINIAGIPDARMEELAAKITGAL